MVAGRSPWACGVVHGRVRLAHAGQREGRVLLRRLKLPLRGPTGLTFVTWIR